MRSTVSLAMIARDEERCLARCLRSVAGVVDEIVVVDTGSTDATVEIARAEGARVLHVPWTDDFSAARNAALDACSGDWRLVLDADEWLAEGAEHIVALRDAPADFVGRLDVVSGFDSPDGWQSAASSMPRVLPRGVRYAGAIHEQPVHKLPVLQLAARVSHDGYESEQMDRKGDRNRRLLEREVDRHPGDAYLRYQLGKDHEVHHRYAQACEQYDRADALGSPSDPWRHDLVVRFMFALKKASRTGDAMTLAERELESWQDSADFFFCLGDVLLDHAIAHPQEAPGLIGMIEGSWLRCLDLGDGGSREGAVAGRGSHLAAHNLAALWETLGRVDDAHELRGRFASV